MVIDDEPHVLHVVRLALETAGLGVIALRDSAEALRLACEQPPDLVITDLSMVGIDGLELAQRLAAHAPTAAVPVILLTGQGFRLTAADLEATNIHCVVPKPFSPTELVALAREQLQAPARGRASDGPRDEERAMPEAA